MSAKEHSEGVCTENLQKKYTYTAFQVSDVNTTMYGEVLLLLPSLLPLPGSLHITVLVFQRIK
jgi:hypothetical protein